MPSASGSYGRQAGRRNTAGILNLEILYRLNYLDFYFIHSSTMLLIVLEVHFNLLFSNKAYFRVYFVVHKIRSPFFSCRSLLLGTSVCNDIIFILLLQTIVGSSLNLPQLSGLRSFGASLSSNVDVDNNGFNGKLTKAISRFLNYIFACKTYNHKCYLVICSVL